MPELVERFTRLEAFCEDNDITVDLKPETKRRYKNIAGHTNPFSNLTLYQQNVQILEMEEKHLHLLQLMFNEYIHVIPKDVSNVLKYVTNYRYKSDLDTHPTNYSYEKTEDEE